MKPQVRENHFTGMWGTESLSAPERRLWEGEESTFAGDEISNTAHQQISPCSGGGGELNSDGSDGVRGAGLSSWVGSADHAPATTINGDAQIREGRNRPGGETGGLGPGLQTVRRQDESAST